MTFDDGIVQICSTENAAAPGNKPVTVLREKLMSYFAYSRLGINRIYQALQAQQQIEAVIVLPDWQDVRIHDVAVLEDGTQFRIQTVQKGTDDTNLKVTTLSLERINEAYEFADSDQNKEST